MQKSISELIVSHLWSLLIFLMVMLATSGIAYLKGFYFLPEEKKSEVKLKHVFIAFIIYIGLSFVLIRFFTSFIARFVPKDHSMIFLSLINLSLSIAIIVILALYLYCIKGVFKNIWKNNDTSVFFDVTIGIILWLVVFPIVSFVSSFLDLLILLIFKVTHLPDQLPIDYLKSTLDNPLFFAIAIFLIMIFAPFVEELLFRGFLQNWLKNLFGRKYAIIITSITFSLFHFSFSQKLGNISILGSLFVLSCFIGFVYEKRSSLISAISLHATFNLITTLNIIFRGT